MKGTKESKHLFFQNKRTMGHTALTTIDILSITKKAQWDFYHCINAWWDTSLCPGAHSDSLFPSVWEWTLTWRLCHCAGMKMIWLLCSCVTGVSDVTKCFLAKILNLTQLLPLQFTKQACVTWIQPTNQQRAIWIIKTVTNSWGVFPYAYDVRRGCWLWFVGAAVQTFFFFFFFS